MELYDTRTRDRVRLVAPHTVRIYVCGITPYDSAHLGHAYVYLVFDVLIRYLQHRGHRVRYVRNVTDVDDDILRAARERGMDYLELARLETGRFDRALAALGLRPPDAVPLATRSIPAIRTAIQGLVESGVAYALADGRVYVDTAAVPEYGGFSRLSVDEQLRQFAEKGGDPDASGKRRPLDFLLWQPSGEGEPAWPSPWGDGRPGWHIECSVMALEELGAVIDIHGGGRDLVFPHHEAEIVQSERLTGQGPFARVWMHAGMVGLGGAKMSKSLGNLVFLADLLERVEPDTIRHCLLLHPYRQDWDYRDELLADSALAVKRWRDAAVGDVRHPALEGAFGAAMEDDLDTPAALQILDRAAASGAGATVRDLATLLGFQLAG